MKRNEEDKYYLEEGDNEHIFDAKSNERLLFLIDKKNNLVFRSMLEEDIKLVVAQCDKLSGSEKRKAKKSLRLTLSEKGSQNYFFVIEEILPIDYYQDNFKSEKPDWIYGYPRRIIGFGARVQEEDHLVARKYDEYIETNIFTKYEERAKDFAYLLEQAGKIYGIEGKFWIMPAESKAK